MGAESGAALEASAARLPEPVMMKAMSLPVIQPSRLTISSTMSDRLTCASEACLTHRAYASAEPVHLHRAQGWLQALLSRRCCWNGLANIHGDELALFLRSWWMMAKSSSSVSSSISRMPPDANGRRWPGSPRVRPSISLRAEQSERLAFRLRGLRIRPGAQPKRFAP